MRRIRAQNDEYIQVGTRSDDGRVAEGCLFIRASKNGREVRVLSRAQALHLIAALVETIRDFEDPLDQ